jgi:hypothetical protein
MKALSAAIVLIIVAGSGAWAQGISIGPGGVRVDDGRRDYDRRGRWDRDRGDRCRMVIERRVNRFGERVTRRTRVCR